MRPPILLTVGLLVSFFFAPVHSFAFDIPQYDGPVTDLAGELKAGEEETLEIAILSIRQQTGLEIGVLIVPTLNGEDISEISVQLIRGWGIGQKERNNGVAILVAIKDRAMFIATGYGSEGAIPDVIAKRIIDDVMAPRFREGDYGGGILSAVQQIAARYSGEGDAIPLPEETETSDGSGWIFAAFVLFQIFASILASSKSWWLGGVLGGILGIIVGAITGAWWSIPLLIVLGLLFDFVVSKTGIGRGGSRGWFIGGGRGGSNGGGGFHFGGGSGGGGGAGGRW